MYKILSYIGSLGYNGRDSHTNDSIKEYLNNVFPEYTFEYMGNPLKPDIFIVGEKTENEMKKVFDAIENTSVKIFGGVISNQKVLLQYQVYYWHYHPYYSDYNKDILKLLDLLGYKGLKSFDQLHPNGAVNFFTYPDQYPENLISVYSKHSGGYKNFNPNLLLITGLKFNKKTKITKKAQKLLDYISTNEAISLSFALEGDIFK